jgi:type II secretory pathway component PulL
VAGDGPHFDQLTRELAVATDLVVRRLEASPMRNVPPALVDQLPRFAGPLGLALREVAPNDAIGVNFRQGEFAYHRGQDELRRAFWRTGALVACVAVLAMTNTFMQYEQQASRLAMVEGQIRNVLSRTLPDVQRITDARAQLQTEVDAAQKRLTILAGLAPANGATAIDVMRTIAATIPDSVPLDVDEYIMEPEAVRIKAKTGSFEAADTIKQQLISTHYFSDVQVKDVKSAADGKVDFRLVLTLGKEGGTTGAARP